MNNKYKHTKIGIIGFAALHLLCCGIPILLLSGMSLTFLAPHWPLIGGVLAVLGLVGFVWYLKHGCATCPRNEGSCSLERGRVVGDERTTLR